MKWVKVVNRKSSISFLHAIAEQKPYFEQLGDYSVGYFWADGITLDVAYSENELINLGKNIAEEIQKDIGFAEKNASLCKRICDEVVDASKKLDEVDLGGMSNKELSRLLKKTLEPYYQLIPFLLIPHSIERLLLGKIDAFINSKVSSKKEKEKYLIWLTVPLKEDNSEVESAFELADYVKNSGWDKHAKKSLEKHAEQFRWLPMWGVNINPLKDSYFRDEVNSLMDKFDRPAKELVVLQRKARIRTTLAKDALRELKADRVMEAYINILQNYIFLRTYRKNAISKSHYYLRTVFDEIASRMKISRQDAYNLAYHEIYNYLNNGEKLDSETLKSRRKGWAILGWDGQPIIFSGKEAVASATEKYSISLPKPKIGKKVKGNVASRGKVKGTVKVALSVDELGKVKKGDILVAIMTTPEYMTAIYRSAAIVTDEGGVTSHAAIISREFGIPCIVGTQNATKVLKDNDYVEVDAEKGIVNILKK